MTSAYAEVIGDPVEHSKSPVIHGYWLEKLGIDAEYRRTRIGPDELSAYIQAQRHNPQWLGCNVTMPLKLDALLLADAKSDASVQAGACNLLIQQAGKLFAANTDVGAIGMVVGQLAAGRTPESVTLLGTGGAARAVLAALTAMGVRQINVQGRNRAEAASLAKLFDLILPPQPFGSPVETDGLINATPLGMSGAAPLDVDLSSMPDHGWVFDLVSSPPQTALVREAERRGIRASGGLPMLIEQAAASFPALFGADPPRGTESDAELRRRLAE
ncbi:MAG TPA: shikimate dehydrogenase [Sphingomicrobium sp.]|jgi:shikimate dehydrogenase|nr:shikimate dehydrogenase [Sphingomicrobium sp.]